MTDRSNAVTEEALPSEESLSFGEFRFDPLNASLYHDGDMVSLPPRSLGLLAQLLERPGTLVTREQLIEGVWNGAYVSDQSVSEAVQVLRHALGDDARHPIYIETVHRRGYRFIAPVTRQQGPAVGIVETPALSPAKSRFLPVAAVLVFVAVAAGVVGWAWLGRGPAPDVEDLLSDMGERVEKLERSVGLFLLDDLAAKRVFFDGFNLPGLISPDGRFIPHSSDNGELALLELATDTVHQVTHLNEQGFAGEPLGGAAISPDGERIAYLWLGPLQETLDLRIQNLDDTGEVIVYNPGETDEISGIGGWTPDGQHVLLDVSSMEGGASHRLVLYSVAEDTSRVVKVLRTRHSIQASISPDGRWIVYDPPRDESAGVRDINLLSLENGFEIPLLAALADDTLPVWTPDGRGIVFVSDRLGSYGHWGLELAGDPPAAAGPPVLLKQDSGIARPLGFAPDGAFFYGIVTGAANIYVVTRDPETGKLIGGPTLISETHSGGNLLPDWSPDGKRLAYVSVRDWVRQRGGAHYLALPSIRGGEVINIDAIQTDFSFFRHARWLPDGESLLIGGTHGDDPERSVYVYDLASRTATLVALGPVPRPKVTADGQELFFGGSVSIDSSEGNSARVEAVFRVNLETKARDVVYKLTPPMRQVGDGFAVSPNGRRLAVLQADRRSETAPRAEVRIVDVADGSSWQLWPLPEGMSILSAEWTPDSTELLLSVADAGSNFTHDWELWRAPLDGGDPEPLGLSMRGLRDMRVDPTGRFVAFTSGVITENGEIWMVENMLREMDESR